MPVVNCRWTTFHNLFLSHFALGAIVGVPMSRHRQGHSCKLQDHFRLRFQWRLREALGRQASAAEEFGPAWEQTLEEFPLAEADQAAVYWDMIRWASSDDLFTGPGARELLYAWRSTVHEY
jgi:hypothetical protein